MNEKGLSLLELMISMTMLIMLSMISIPTYKGYIQRAALTNLLQHLMPYKNAVELCLITAEIKQCDNGNQDIPLSQASRYIQSIQVTQGNILIQGEDTLATLQIKATP